MYPCSSAPFEFKCPYVYVVIHTCLWVDVCVCNISCVLANRDNELGILHFCFKRRFSMWVSRIVSCKNAWTRSQALTRIHLNLYSFNSVTFSCLCWHLVIKSRIKFPSWIMKSAVSGLDKCFKSRLQKIIIYLFICLFVYLIQQLSSSSNCKVRYSITFKIVCRPCRHFWTNKGYSFWSWQGQCSTSRICPMMKKVPGEVLSWVQGLLWYPAAWQFWYTVPCLASWKINTEQLCIEVNSKPRDMIYTDESVIGDLSECRLTVKMEILHTKTMVHTELLLPLVLHCTVQWLTVQIDSKIIHAIFLTRKTCYSLSNLRCAALMVHGHAQPSAGVRGNERADGLASTACITSGLLRGRAEALRGLKNFWNRTDQSITCSVSVAWRTEEWRKKAAND